MTEVVTVNITEETLFNLTISDDSASATVSVPNEIATVALSLQDLNLELVNADPTSPGQVFKASSGNFYTLRSLKDDNKTIEISESADNNNIEFKIPDAGLSVPDNFKLNADSDATANITLSGGTVDLNKAKLTTDLDANSQDINSISTIRSTTGNVTTINATTINTSDLNVSDDIVLTDDLTVGGTVAVTENVNVTGTMNATNITGGDVDTDTGTIDTLDGVTSTYTNINGTNGAITTLTGTTSTYTTANATTVNTTDLVASGDVQGATGTITTLDGTTATYGTVNGTTVNATNVIASGDVDASTGTIDTLDGTTATITTVNSTTANTTNLIASGDVDASTGTIDTLDGTTATYTTVNATNVVASGDVDASTGTIDTLDGTTATITTVNATTVNATDVNSTNLTLTGDISADDASLGGNVTVAGNLTVSGTTTTVNTETIELADNNIVLNSNHTGAPTQDSGLTVERGTSDDAVFQWNETDDKFEVKVGSSHATLKANALESDSLTATSATITTGTIPTLSSTTITGTTINATDLNVSDDLAVTDDVSIGGNVAVTQNIVTSGNQTIGGDVDLTGDFTIGGSLIGLGELTDVSAIRIGITNPAEASGDGIVLWDRTTNWALENKLSTSNNTDDIHHTGGVAPIGDIVYISNEVINMSANIVATGGTDSTVIKSGELFLEEGTGGSTYNSQLDAQKLVIDEVRTNKINNRSGTGDITLSDSIVPEDDGTKALGSDANRFSHVFSDAVSITGALTTDSISPTNVSDNTIDVAANLVPTANVTFSLGSTTNQWHSAHIGPGSLFIDGHKVLGSDATGQIDITTDDDQNLNISAGADGTTGDITIFSAGATTSLNDTTVNLGPSNNTGTTNIRGTLDVVTKIEVGDLDLTSGNIKQDLADGNLEIETTGTGYIHLKTADAYVGASVSNALHLDENSIEVVGGTTLTLKEDVDVTGVIKVDDGFTLTTFNPYGSGSSMPTAIMGVGNEDGWAGIHVRNRGEHDFGLGSGLNFSPRALMVMSAGRKTSGSDDYLDNGDEFGVLSYNPYSAYRTGSEWLTPSAEISAIATENHSASGFGTKLRISTTENGEEAGASESTHTNKNIEIHGTTITTSDTLKIDDSLIVTGTISNDGGDVTVADTFKVTGADSNFSTIADQTITSNNYAIHGLKVQADDTRWGAVLIKEFEGGANKPALSGFTNPTFGTEIVGGTPSSPAAVSSGKRTFVLQSLAANQSDGTIPDTAGAMLKFETTESQTTTGMGHKVAIESIANGATSRSSSIIAQGGNITLHAEGDANIQSGGDLILNDDVKITGTLNQQGAISNSDGDVTVDDNLVVNNNLTVNGNTTLGNQNTDVATATAKLVTQNGLVLTSLNTATANTLAGLGVIDEGSIIYCTDGDSGSKCLAVYDGSNFKRVSLGANISSS